LTTTTSDTLLAEEIHKLLVALTVRIKAHEDGCLGRLSLTRMEAKALYRLEPGEAVPVRTIAERGGVDPSNLSAAVESLVVRGFVERVRAPHDGRVRAVRLTRDGERARERLAACLHAGHPAVARLEPEEREALRTLLRRLETAA
jgi:DNA-binding MarR family transcriptional regulator